MRHLCGLHAIRIRLETEVKAREKGKEKGKDKDLKIDSMGSREDDGDEVEVELTAIFRYCLISFMIIKLKWESSSKIIHIIFNRL